MRQAYLRARSLAPQHAMLWGVGEACDQASSCRNDSAPSTHRLAPNATQAAVIDRQLLAELALWDLDLRAAQRQACGGRAGHRARYCFGHDSAGSLSPECARYSPPRTLSRRAAALPEARPLRTTSWALRAPPRPGSAAGRTPRPDAAFAQQLVLARGAMPVALCEALLRAAEQLDGWRLAVHTPYPTLDTHVHALRSAGVRRDFGAWLQDMLYPAMARAFRTPEASLTLRVKEAVVIRYEAASERGGKGGGEGGNAKTPWRDELGWHRDNALLSFNVLLNPPAGFEGGGTAFEGVSHPTLVAQGDLLMHPGKVRHAGLRITSGRRYVLAGFLQACFECSGLPAEP